MTASARDSRITSISCALALTLALAFPLLLDLDLDLDSSSSSSPVAFFSMAFAARCGTSTELVVSLLLLRLFVVQPRTVGDHAAGLPVRDEYGCLLAPGCLLVSLRCSCGATGQPTACFICLL